LADVPRAVTLAFPGRKGGISSQRPADAPQRNRRSAVPRGWARTLALAGLLSAIAGATPAQAQTIDLLSRFDLRIDGGGNFHHVGQSVAGAGDVNGDGRPDVIVSSSNAAKAYVIFGGLSTGQLDLAAPLGSRGFVIKVRPGPRSASSWRARATSTRTARPT
jgi:FG-GAP repeat